MITTQEIVRKHKVTRQTLNNWIKKYNSQTFH